MPLTYRIKNMRAGEGGIALFLVLWVLTLISVIVGEFSYAMRTEVNIVRNYKEKTQAYYIAVAGIHRGISEIVRNALMPRKRTVDGEENNTLPWRVNVDIPAIDFTGGQYKVAIHNESGKINLNVADQALLTAMLDSLDLPDKEKNIIVDSILDWRDSNNLHRINGAEDDYYLSLPKPYPCKNGDFESIEELSLVKGVTPELYRDVLSHIVTVYGALTDENQGKQKKNKWDKNKINMNAAPPEVLLTLPLVTHEIVEKITEYRKEKDFYSLADLITVMGGRAYAASIRHMSVKNSPYYTVHAVGRVSENRNEHHLKVVVEIDKKTDEKYRVLKWWDQSKDPKVFF